MNSNVTIRLHEQTDEAITFALENSTEQPIYVSYLPPKEGDIATFLAHGLERRADTEGKFEPYGAGFHFVPNLSPIAPRTVVLFHLLSTSVKKGEYRVLVGYYDNIDIYKLVNEKAPNWTDVEKEKIKRAYRIASSDTFSISRGQSND